MAEYDYEELLIDGDLLVFSSCAAIEYGREAEEYDFAQIANNIEGRIMAMKKRLKARKVRIFFSSKDNFRYVVLPEYKANRKGAYIPENLANAKAHVMTVFQGEMEPGLEADDLLAINQKTDGTTIIATIDKDIPQVRGMHYRWETQHKGEEIFEVTGMGKLIKEVKGSKTKITGNGIRFFCYQLLIGDPTDGIIGCGEMIEKVYKSGVKAGQAYVAREGIGPVKAYELLEHAITYPKLMGIVQHEYKKRFGDAWEEKLLQYGRCLFMTNRLNDDGSFQLWHFKSEEFQNSWFDPHKQEVISMRG
jgi:5'-3' exonuclease